MLPNATIMIETLPNELKRICYDSLGKAHSCAITEVTSTPSLGDFGVLSTDGTDELYVAKPFSVPSSKRIKVAHLDGSNAEVRRIESVVDNVVFLVLTLGEKARA